MSHVQCRDRVRHFVRVVFRIDLLKDPGDAATGVDDERRTDDAPILSPVHRFLLPDAVLFGDGVIDVGEQSKRKLVLFLEFPVRLW